MKNIGSQRCELLIAQQFDAKGNLSAKTMNQQIPNGFRNIFLLQATFSRDDEIDAENRQTFMRVLRNASNEVYSEEENSMVERIMHKLEKIEVEDFQILKSLDFRIKV